MDNRPVFLKLTGMHRPTADEIIATLGLAPLPHEGGWFRQTYCSRETLPGGRPAGTAIYFLLTRTAFSALHRVDADEVWHFLGGDPVEHLMLDPRLGEGRLTALGSSFGGGAGQTPQLIVPAGVWQGARLYSPPPDDDPAAPTRQGAPARARGSYSTNPFASAHAWALFSCTMSPGWDERGFELGERDALTARHAAWAQTIRALTR